MDPTQPQPADQPQREDGARLDPRERQIRDELTLLDPALAGFFEDGVRYCHDSSRPGSVYMLGHAGRELSLGVVSALLGGRTAGSEIPETVGEGDEDKETFRLQIAAALELPPTHPVVKAWAGAHKTLVAAAHHRRGAPPPDRAATVAAFRDLGNLLFGRIAPFFATIDELDGLLGIAAPTKAQVMAARPMLSRRMQRVHFYRRLEHSGWLSHLLEIEMLSVPVPFRNAAGERAGWYPWPESDYLVRMASSDPRQVLLAFERIDPQLRNPIVAFTAAEAALAAPFELGLPVAERLAGAIASADRHFLLADRVLKLAVRLAELGHGDAAFALAEKLIWLARRPRRFSVSEEDRRTEPVLERINDHDIENVFRRLLPALERADARRTFELLAQRVNTALVYSASDEDRRAGNDWSTIWCPSLERDPQPHHDEPRELLLLALAGVARRLVKSNPAEAAEVLKILGARRWDALHRVRLLVLSEVGAAFQDEVGVEVGDTSLIGGHLGLREIGVLVSTSFHVAPAKAQEALIEAILDGPERADDEALKRFYGRSRTEEEWRQLVAHWQADRLRWFRDEVPPRLRELSTTLQDLVNSPAADDDGPAAVWVGREEPSPLSTEQFAQMNPQEIVRFLATWQESEEGSQPTKHGLASSLSTLVKLSPIDRAELLTVMREKQVDVIYRAAALSGLLQAANDKQPIPWKEALELSNRLFELPIVTGEHENAEKSAMNEAMQIAVELLNAGARNDQIPPALHDLAWSLAQKAFTHVETSPVVVERAANPGDARELLMAALNTFSGKTMDMILSLGLWHHRRSEDGSLTGPAKHRLIPLMEQVLNGSVAADAAVRARIGQYIPFLLLMAREWTLRSAARLFNAPFVNGSGDPVWVGYITRNRLYDSVFADLQPQYQLAVSSLVKDTGADVEATKDREWTPSRHLLVHLGLAYLRRLVDPGEQGGDLLERAFDAAAARDKGHVYWLFYRDFEDSDKPIKDSIVARLVSMWEWRLRILEEAGDSPAARSEAGELGWFGLITAISAEVALPLMLRTARAARGEFRMAHSVWERAAELTGKDPSGAAAEELAELLVQAELRSEYPYFPTDSVRPVLEQALGALDKASKERAVRLVNTLGEAGFVEFRSLLE